MSEQARGRLVYFEQTSGGSVSVYVDGEISNDMVDGLRQFTDRKTIALIDSFMFKSGLVDDVANVAQSDRTPTVPIEITPKPAPDIIKGTIEVASDVDYGFVFSNHLRTRGAEKQWIRMSYGEIGELLGIPNMEVKFVIDAMLERYHDARICRVMAGPSKGNNFTFNQEIPFPDEKVKTPKPAVVTAPQNGVVVTEPPKAGSFIAVGDDFAFTIVEGV